MSHLEIRGLTGQGWAIGEVHLTDGLWVLLVQDERVAEELAQQLIGVAAPKKGIVLLNGKSPYCHPATRAVCASVLTCEPRLLEKTVGDSLALNLQANDSASDTQDSLPLPGLEHLRARTAPSLSPSERRQVAFAIAMARKAVELSVYCEPRLDLSAAQISTLQMHMTELAARSCVLCITSSLHDARQLGGPHAQLSRSDWVWTGAGENCNPIFRVAVEGSGLGPVAAELAVHPSVVDLTVHNRDLDRQLLHVQARTIDDITTQIVRAARRFHAKVTRLWVEDADCQVRSKPNPHQTTYGTKGSNAVPSPSQHCNLVRIALRRYLQVLVTTLAGGAVMVLVLGEPVVAGTYAAAQLQFNAAGAVQKSLSFLISGVVPLGSLLASRLFTSASADGNLIEAFARFGVNRRFLVSINWAVVSLLSAVIAGGSAILVMLPTHDVAWTDLGVAAWIAACGGATYAGILTAIASLRRTWVQWAFLIADYLLGGATLGISSVFPHAHLLNLMGVPWAQELPQPVSFMFLGTLLILAYGLMLIRTED